MRPPRRGPARELALGRRTAHVTIHPVLDGYELLCHGCHERAADRLNLFIKIPAAHQGHAAIAACLAEGISINVTLIFSLSRYGAVMDAFLDGMNGQR
jgi:hypothetical protein